MFTTINKTSWKHTFSKCCHHTFDTCLIFLTSKISKRFEEGQLTGMILGDLQNTFDSINYKTLLKILYFTGFSKHSKMCFQSSLELKIPNESAIYALYIANINSDVSQRSFEGHYLCRMVYISSFRVTALRQLKNNSSRTFQHLRLFHRY